MGLGQRAASVKFLIRDRAGQFTSCLLITTVSAWQISREDSELQHYDYHVLKVRASRLTVMG